MAESETSTTAERMAWEPLTPRGVAAFAGASSNRLFLVQFLVALGVAATVVWFLHTAWFPTVGAACRQLPLTGEIRAGRLEGTGDSPRMLAEGTFLAFSVDLNHTGELRSPAHVQVEFGRTEVRVRSLLGYVELAYPADRVLEFNRERLVPWWGAWRPQLLVLAGIGTVGALMAIWFLLAVIYAPGVWLLTFYLNRDLRLVECWRLAGAALMPGAGLMAAGLLLYGFGVLDLVGLGFVTAGHLLLGWVYLFLSPLFLSPSVPAGAARRNPFVRPPT